MEECDFLTELCFSYYVHMSDVGALAESATDIRSILSFLVNSKECLGVNLSVDNSFDFGAYTQCVFVIDFFHTRVNGCNDGFLVEDIIPLFREVIDEYIYGFHLAPYCCCESNGLHAP